MRQPLTRESISRAARDILVSEGLHSVSLRRVASVLGVTAPALYAHVVDKRDLLQGIAEDEVGAILQGFQQVQSEDPVEDLRSMCRAYIDYGIQNPDLFRAIFLFRPELTAEPRAGQPALSEKILGAFVDGVRRAQQQQLLGERDPDLAALAIWTTAHGVVTTLLSGPPLDIELKNRLGDTAVNVTLLGLRNGAFASVA